MDGATLGVGSVACVNGVKNPISLARLVMEKTEHCMLAGPGARCFADEMGIAVTPDDELTTEATRREFGAYQRYGTCVQDIFGSDDQMKSTADSEGHSPSALGHDTVGAVAVDARGNIASATSTGGVTLKRPGRVGDSPLVGCGGYADSHAGGCSATGHGEALMRFTASSRAVAMLEAGMEPGAAAKRCLHAMHSRTGGRGGLILVAPDGRVGHHGTTKRMAWASRASVEDAGALRSGVDNHAAFAELA